MTIAAPETQENISLLATIDEIVPPAPSVALAHAYETAGTIRVLQEQEALLLTPLNPADVQIRPDGIIYLPWIHFAKLLNKAFGPMGWAVIRIGPDLRDDDGIVTVPMALKVDGRLVRDALGDCRQAQKMTYASAREGAVSDALSKCCKALGMYADLWDPNWRYAWQQEHALQVYAKQFSFSKPDLLWRRKDHPQQFFWEGQAPGTFSMHQNAEEKPKGAISPEKSAPVLPSSEPLDMTPQPKRSQPAQPPTLRQQVITAYRAVGLSDETMRALLSFLGEQYKRKIETLKDLTEEELQKLLTKIKDGAITGWSKGLLKILSKACTEHAVAPGDLAAWCKAHYGQAAIGEMMHTNRIEVYEAAVSGRITEWSKALAHARDH